MDQPVADVYLPKRELSTVEVSRAFTIKIHERATVQEIQQALDSLPVASRVRKVEVHKAAPNDQRDWDTVTIYFQPEKVTRGSASS